MSGTSINGTLCHKKNRDKISAWLSLACVFTNAIVAIVYCSAMLLVTQLTKLTLVWPLLVILHEYYFIVEAVLVLNTVVFVCVENKRRYRVIAVISFFSFLVASHFFLLNFSLK